MLKRLLLAAFAMAIAACPAFAQENKYFPEMGFIQETREVTIRSAGGKARIAEGLSKPKELWEKKQFDHMPEGSKCKVEKGDTIWRIGQIDANTVEVRLVIGYEVKPGFCTSLTKFAITRAEWAVARQAFRDRWKNIREGFKK